MDSVCRGGKLPGSKGWASLTWYLFTRYITAEALNRLGIRVEEVRRQLTGPESILLDIHAQCRCGLSPQKAGQWEVINTPRLTRHCTSYLSELFAF